MPSSRIVHRPRAAPRSRGWPAVLMVVAALAAPYRVAGQVRETAAPLPPAEAARTMQVPEGFHVTLFAGEPDVQQPIGFCIDDRGRLWVAEAYNYPDHGRATGDRIVILEDADGDGRFDRRRVFYEGLNYVTGIEVGFGGAWVMSPPYFYFIADRNRDDQPDGEPAILLDGFGNHANSHNLANALAWGPDGWLYGTHGRTNWSLIGKPGTPEPERMRFDGGVYRYHPVRHIWEPFADGTTNPWGIDWDDYGQGFVCNCVGPHLYHVIQGAHYEPWRNRESSRYAYQRIGTIADHLHYVSEGNVVDDLRTPEEHAAGGGHAHCGTMVYLGDNWPDRYRNTIFMHNLHGRRINNDLPRRAGSGYLASHGPDLAFSKDEWYMGVTLQYGPDGAVYSSDWSDTGECHSMVNTRRGTGRIFKISYGRPSTPQLDMDRRTDLELVALQLHRNDWFVRHARRLLQERAAEGRDLAAAAGELQRLLATSLPDDRQLRLIWTLHVIGRTEDDFLVGRLSNDSEYIRGWAVRLLTEDHASPARALHQFPILAATDPSAFVGLHLASALQRLAPNDRWPIAEALASRTEFASDANIPLMVWYGIEPLVHEDLARFVDLGVRSELPLIQRHVARRIVDLRENGDAIEKLLQALVDAKAAARHQQLLEGALQGLAGTRTLDMPDAWRRTYAHLRTSSDPVVPQLARRLALIFDDPAEIQATLGQAQDPAVPADDRQLAIELLVAKHVAEFDTPLIELVRDPATRRAALRGLAEYQHPDTATAILAIYSASDATTRQDALQTLAARPAWAWALLEALESNRIPRADLTAYTARQIFNLGDKKLSARLQRLWGPIRETQAERTRQIADYQQRLTPDELEQGNPGRGRMLFTRLCANCHRLFDSGTAIGPDLTGSQRSNLDYLLLNLVDPSASIAADYRMEVVQTTAGRVVTGILVGESDRAIQVQTANEKIVIPQDEIEDRAATGVSLMPDGLLQGLNPSEVRDLIAYLMGPQQVPLPPGDQKASSPP